jgi:hypothetical protein
MYLRAILGSLQQHLVGLSDLPRGTVEPLTINIKVSAVDGGTLGECVAFPAPMPADVKLHIPRIARAGLALDVGISLNEDYTSAHANALAEALNSLAAHLCISAAVVSSSHPLVEPVLLVPAFVVSASSHAVFARFSIPPITSDRTRPIDECQVILTALLLAGRSLVTDMPLCFPVTKAVGLSSPRRRMHSDTGGAFYCTAVVSAAGELFVGFPRQGAISLYDRNLIPLMPVKREELNIQGEVMTVALSDDDDVLILGASFSGTEVVAHNLSTRTERWRASGYAMCFGLAILPAAHSSTAGSVIASSHSSKMLHVLSIADGAELARSETPTEPVYLAADPLSSTVFVNVDSPSRVLVYDWDATARTLFLRCQLEGVPEATHGDEYHPLAVMPPSPGDNVGHLVVASHASKSLLVFSLPDLRLVLTHTISELSGNVRGLAADPAGISLVVLCATEMRVLPWPLEG